MFDYAGKAAVVTGSAGNLGQAVSRAFASSGALLALIDRPGERLDALFQEISEVTQCRQFAIDLLDLESVEDMANGVIDAFGKIDILVNIAGGYRGGNPVHETEPETWDFLMSLNAKSIIHTARATVPHMLAQGRGKIVNIGATAGLSASAKIGAYSASKSAVIRLTESMSAELKRQGINVNAILPNTLDTPQNRENFPNADFSKWVPPEQIASVILFLTSDAAQAIHGAAIPVKGLG